MSSPASDRDATGADIEGSFGSRLVLMPCEHVGVVIGSSDVYDTFVGIIYNLVAKVLTYQLANRDRFIRTFLQLWKGSADVSIKELTSIDFGCVLLVIVIKNESLIWNPGSFGAI
ncbi:unnamed protein product [Prunus armeniaca]|uniref:Uncharacterized protein n=1 Tax=Prunus armeniaca TaxID=36596 RepID=A0A6J5XD07_PRUAR|nr:unnamed protein product [Prunus armeniaca]CAB4309952.1 unnamed protein product [Prunus armeniaca]